MSEQKVNPIRIGWESVKANRKPMFVVWAAVIALAVAYWRIPGFAGVLEPVRLWQERNGAAAAFTTQLFFCGVLPALFLATVSEIKTNHYLLKCADTGHGACRLLLVACMHAARQARACQPVARIPR